MIENALTGGTAEDRAAIMAKFNAYLVANDDMDWEALQTLFSPAPETVFFNLNGNTYQGRAHWTKLWQYYKTRVRNGVWEPFDLGGTVSADLAVIWCHRRTAYKWNRRGAARCRAQARAPLRVALHHGVPQGGRRLARRPCPFLAGQRGSPAGRRLAVRSRRSAFRASGESARQ